MDEQEESQGNQICLMVPRSSELGEIYGSTLCA